MISPSSLVRQRLDPAASLCGARDGSATAVRLPRRSRFGSVRRPALCGDAIAGHWGHATAESLYGAERLARRIALAWLHHWLCICRVGNRKRFFELAQASAARCWVDVW